MAPFERMRPRLSPMPFPTTPVYEDLFHRRAVVELDVLVVGGSIAGLSAAYNLKQAGHNVRVLEKSDGKPKVFAGLRVPPNMAKLLQHWGIGQQMRQKAVQCPKIDFVNGSTGAHQSSLIYHKELMKELQADMYGMHYGDLYEMIRNLVLRSEVPIDYNATVVDVDVDGPSVLLDGGKRIHADIVVGADGTYSLVREKVVGSKEKHAAGSFNTYSYLVPVSKMKQDPLLRSLVKDGTWTLWTGNTRCALNYLVSAEHYVVQLFDSKSSGKLGWTQTSSLSQLNMSEFEERIQRLLSLGDRAIETQHVIQEPIEEWYSDNGKVVLVGNSVHVSNPGSTNETALAVEDGAVLGSLFSRLQKNNPDEILRVLGAYQQIRQERCAVTLQSDLELVTFSTLPPGPARDERDAGFAMASEHQALDWEDAGEDILRGAWEEFRSSFGYEAYDAADDWWVDWGVMLQRMTAAQSIAVVESSEASTTVYEYTDGDDKGNYDYSSRPYDGTHSPILGGLKTQTVVTTVEN